MNYALSYQSLQIKEKVCVTECVCSLTFQQDSQNSFTLTVRQSVMMKTVRESEGRQL